MPKTAIEIAHTWFRRVWNEGRVDAIAELASPLTRFHGLTDRSLDGLEAFRRYHASFRSAFPDIHVTVEKTVVQDDTVVAYCHVTGTHTGNGLGVAPTNRRFEMYGFGMARIVNGQVVESWNTFDFLSLYRQLGIAPPEERATAAGR